MPECTACGSHLSTDYLRVCGDNEGALASCPHCSAGRTAGEQRPATGAGGPSRSGNGDDASNVARSVASDDAGPGESRNDAGPGDSPSDESAFAVKTAGRSLEWPRVDPGAAGSADETDAERSEAAPAAVVPRSKRQGDPSFARRNAPRSRSVLSTVLDIFR